MLVGHIALQLVHRTALPCKEYFLPDELVRHRRLCDADNRKKKRARLNIKDSEISDDGIEEIEQVSQAQSTSWLVMLFVQLVQYNVVRSVME